MLNSFLIVLLAAGVCGDELAPHYIQAVRFETAGKSLRQQPAALIDALYQHSMGSIGNMNDVPDHMRTEVQRRILQSFNWYGGRPELQAYYMAMSDACGYESIAWLRDNYPPVVPEATSWCDAAAVPYNAYVMEGVGTDPNHWFMARSHDALWETHDRGTTWQAVTRPGTCLPYVSAIAPGSSVDAGVCIQSEATWHTRTTYTCSFDSGMTWRVPTAWPQAPRAYRQLTLVPARPALRYAVWGPDLDGDSREKAALVFSYDGGNSWTLDGGLEGDKVNIVGTLEDGSVLCQVQDPSAEHDGLWVRAPSGTTSRVELPWPGQSIVKVVLNPAAPTHRLALHQQRRTGKQQWDLSRDGGATWEPQPPCATTPVFLDAQGGYVCLEEGPMPHYAALQIVTAAGSRTLELPGRDHRLLGAGAGSVFFEQEGAAMRVDTQAGDGLHVMASASPRAIAR